MSVEDLRQVVPDPLDEIYPEDEPQYVPEPPKKTWVHKASSILLNVQKYSAYGFLGFYGLHTASTVIVPGLGISQATCQDIFEMCRNVYMAPLLEPAMVNLTAVLHIGAGLALRLVRMVARRKKAQKRERDIIIKEEDRDDIGLGGIGTIFGLGFKKSWISSNFPSFTPLTFSGYVFTAALAYHYAKMKLGPVAIDGDSSLVTLSYVTHYFQQSHLGQVGCWLNYGMLALVSWVSFYHVVSGLFKYRRQFSLRAKKIAYGVIAFLTGLSVVSMTRMRHWELEVGFLGKQFAKYLFANYLFVV
ncbi:hypothetical protein FT663_03291 [Candidozyma haemuli var. vulneris]|uniref:Mitochondrial adapter protein MCP1 transmembrane domain-containing protein n=1 Tax=Candidozyma haemuli TaxID=45357 RepID=A0A2V1AUJ0_9ASCO|nr:hypothetical protein CXQ85_000459 [[Candida] haemuloni]KAF3988439.1 hypothetical protein FT662_03388 [[Candida] haemuloni var. vulneris]KAF3990142.1 hypothetical protein FT663_03291 [[Candida] haemuloni var. vulneris]PVH21479.1 hypothetical protein CXQ85_000459 [[Candida] haemuloni]